MNFTSLSRKVFKTAKTGRIRDLLNLCRAAYALSAEPCYVRSRPFHIYLEPTTRCNLQCRMCSQAVSERPKLDLGFERFLTLLRHFPYLQDLQLQGAGEPLLNPDIFKMIEYSKSNDIRVGLFTNATLIDPAVAKKIAGSGLDWINLSLDAADPGVYEIIRKGAGYEEVINNIKTLMAVNKKKGPLVSIWFTAMKMNIFELPAVIRLAKDLGVRKVVAQGMHFWGSEYLRQNLKEDSLFKDTALTKEVFIRASAEAKRLGVRLDFRPRYFQKAGKKYVDGRGCPVLLR